MSINIEESRVFVKNEKAKKSLVHVATRCTMPSQIFFSGCPLTPNHTLFSHSLSLTATLNPPSFAVEVLITKCTPIKLNCRSFDLHLLESRLNHHLSLAFLSLCIARNHNLFSYLSELVIAVDYSSAS